ncbi:hypothetical protein [Halosolutus gelatinilyticus]|uniref:hypothetical protein n=1 Tax=Halosolutus gelatinilyticus TaxID=2931975 RepID=UPI001FF4D474|nr:hypothetical protein [Halosolutus gelatinilyticus]
MDLTQIALGVALLVVSTLTFVGPSVLESHALVYALTGATLLIGAGALVVCFATDQRE